MFAFSSNLKGKTEESYYVRIPPPRHRQTFKRGCNNLILKFNAVIREITVDTPNLDWRGFIVY